MASYAATAPQAHVSAAVDAGFWGQDLSDSSNLALHLSPGSSSTTLESVHSNSTPPAQTPKSDSNAQNGRAAQPARTSVAVACVPCRSRHLKCDGGVRCSRCRSEGAECTYIKSRRGWKGKRKNKTGENSTAAPIPGQLNTNLSPTSIGPVSAVQLSSPEYPYVDRVRVDSLDSSPSTVGVVTLSPPSTQYNLDGTQRLDQSKNLPQDAISSFYYYFFNAHPFCLPRHRLLQVFKERRAPLLEFAVHYVGSSFVPALPTQSYREALDRMIMGHNYPKDGYSVQALLLFAICLHANNDVPRSAQVFSIAHALTLELGMQRADFSIIHGCQDPVLEESWRRTWWSMFTANGMLTAVNPGVQFRLKDIATDVPLPCTTHQYVTGQIPYPQTLQDYDDSGFAAEQLVFSSFTYLIDAIRILGKVFEVARLDGSFQYHAVDVVDTYLSNWRLNLPVSMTEIVNTHGEVDEVLFQAHMVNNGSTIMLHRPRSNLGFNPVAPVNLCVQPGQILLPTQTREIHTAKCLTAAENISSLIKLPASLIHHTPFFTCVVVMASVVHLSYWSFLVPDGQDDIIKQSIRLDVGTLQQYSNTWPIAHIVLGQVRGVAHTLWNSKKAMSIHLWNNIAQDEIIRSAIEEGSMVPVETYSQLIAPMLKS
ncbi:hypothetical protein BU24DRAFT_152763 [Aaosphaeria arxii CBS 175.79]|uniref:Zn(2)-C6 fungal-type domain-containing protein n=1 Tax=Aaosphaeria arxii CBS 175.79 TaxID=1450172 RepID=A0A6A5XW57_9PLEO|nr:uncharacterized protein BU24DRAFT_152763 [Aaosphaeria arxii CBS 175.79]KAF2017565.1 hypothetical protein BU24DRAFT_152763 [Aaosphaeria arxii CBS 175.79]